MDNTLTPERSESQRLTNGVKRPGILFVLFMLLLGLCVLGALFYIGWKPKEKAQATLNSNADLVKTAPLRVTIIAPKKSDAFAKLILPGDIQAERETTIYARTGGYVKSWKADIGDRVKAGQLLAEIDAPELDIQLDQAISALKQSEAMLAQSKAALENSKAQKDQATAQLGTAKARLEMSSNMLKRYESLRGSGSLNEVMIIEKDAEYKAAKSANTVAIANVTTAQTAIDSAQSAIGVAVANVDVAKVAVTRLEILKSFEKVTAPFDGVITARKTEIGALVMGGSGSTAQELFHLANMDTVRVFIDVPQSVAPAVKKGQTVQLKLREYPNGKFEGAITRTTQSIDPASRTLRTEVRVPNPTGELMSGMYAQVNLNVPQPTPPLLVPGSALIVNAQGTQLAIVRDGRVHFQPVYVESDFGTNVSISSGLNETDTVIANPSERLSEGIQVTTTPAGQ